MDFSENLFECFSYVPVRIVGPHFRKIADVADMVAFAVLVEIFPLRRLSSQGLTQLKRFQDRNAVLAAAADIVDLTGTRILAKRFDESGYVKRMNVVTHLFSFVAVYLIDASHDVALNEITKE